jgi:hypothetical protein
LRDTRTSHDKTFVYLIYIQQIRGYFRDIENYQFSRGVYKNSIGENNTDVAQANNNIALEYRPLGGRKKELEVLWQFVLVVFLLGRF